MKPSVIVDLLLSNKDMIKRLEKLVYEKREMNEESLDASVYKGDLRSYLEKLPEFELMRIIEKLSKDQKEIREGYDNHQDVENNDATNRGHHTHNDSKVKSTYNEGQKEECLGRHVQQVTDVGTACPPNLDQNPLGHCGYSDSEVRPKINKEGQKKHLGWHDQQVTDYHGVNRKGHSVAPQNSSDGKIKERRNKQHSWEFPLPNPDKSQPRDSSTAEEELAESNEESSDSNSSYGGSETTSSSRQPGTSSPVQPFAEDNRDILHPREQTDQTPELASRDQDSEPHHSCQRYVQDARDQLPPNLQTWDLELLDRLSETVRNNSQVIATLLQENGQSQHIRQTSCPNWDALREENNELKDQLVNWEQLCQQLQEQIAAHEKSFRDQEHRISLLTQWRIQLDFQNAALEDVIQTQNEEKKGYKMIEGCLVKKIRKLQEERDMASRRAHEVDQKKEEELKNALRNTVKYMTLAIEEIEKKYMAEKEKNEILERKLKDSEEKGKEEDQGLAEQGSSSVHESSGYVQQPRTQQRHLQHRPGINYPGDEEKDPNPQHDNEDDIN